MADQNTGGDGSVRWSLVADHVDRTETTFSHEGDGRGRHHQRGIDHDGQVGDWFTVSIEVPAEIGSVEDYLKALKDGEDNLFGLKRDPTGADRIYFNVRIESRNPDQIRVSWGGSEHVNRPVKGD
jgi:hypothetical protein